MGTQLWDDEGSVQEFQFDGAYAGAVSPGKGEAARPAKRQPKRRGLWHACFAQPLADEPVASSPSPASPSRLTLNAQQLTFRRPGSPETQQLPLSTIRDVEYKWVQAGGVRVSKVTVTFDSGKEPVVIRGLKNPEALVEAVRRQQKVVAKHHADKSPGAEVGPRNVAHTSPAGRWSDTPGSSAKRLMTPRALFADATGSPTSVANSGCGSMTLMSAFARSPAQEFAGADSVAREIQLASPGNEDLSYSSSSASLEPDLDTTPTKTTSRASPPPYAAVAYTTPHVSPPADARVAALRGVPPPQQASDTFVLPLGSLLLPGEPRAACSGPAGARAEELGEGLMLTQNSPQGPARPSPRTDGGSPPPRAEDSPLLGGSPPPRAEDSLPEGASMSASVQGSPHPAPPFVAGCSPPPVPEDSVVYAEDGGASTPLSPLSSNAPGAAGSTFSPSSCAGSGPVGVPRSVSLPPLRASRRAGICADALSRSASSGSASASSGRLAEASFSALRMSAGPLPPPSDAADAAVSDGLDSSESSVLTPRLVPSVTKQQRQQHEGGGHRLSHSSLAAAQDEPVGPVVRSDLGGSSFKTVSSGELMDGLGAALPPPPAPALASAGAGVADRRSTSPVGALSIAAVSATVAALLTSSALGGVGLEAAPSAVAAAGSGAVAAAGSTAAAAASVAAAPLTLLGLTAAAAVTLVAAAAVTHIRTGSPLRPLDFPKDADSLKAAAHAEPLLAASTRGYAGQVPESSASWFGVHSYSTQSVRRAASDTAPGSASSVSGAAADGPQLPIAAEVVVVAAASAAGGVGSARAGSTPPPDLTAEPSLRGDGDARKQAAVGRGATTGSSECSEEDVANSGAWGSQHALSELDLEQAAVAPVAHPQAQSSVACGTGTTKVAAGSGPGYGNHQPQLTEEEALPVMLFSGGPGGMPPPPPLQARGGEQGGAGAAAASSAQHTQPQPQPAGFRAMGADELSAILAAISGGSRDTRANGRTGGQSAQPAARAVHGGELRPPPSPPLAPPVAEAPWRSERPGPSYAYAAAAAPMGSYHQQPQLVAPAWIPSPPQPAVPWRDPTVRQLFRDDYEALRQAPVFSPVPATSSSSAQWRHQQSSQQTQQQPQQQPQPQQREGQKEAAIACALRLCASPPVAVTATGASSLSPAAAVISGLAPAASIDSAPSATSRPRARQLTESPVRVLYSVYSANKGLLPADPWAQEGPGAPVLPTCEPAVAECAVQTEAGTHASSAGAEGNRYVAEVGVAAAVIRVSSSAGGSHRSTTSSGSDHGNGIESGGPAADSAAQQVFALQVPQETGSLSGSSAGSRSAVSAGVGADKPHADGPSPPQAGAHDWYMSSLVVDPSLGGFELGAAAAAEGHARRGPPVSPSSAVDSSVYSSPAFPACSSPAAASPAGEGLAQGAGAAANEEETPLLGRGALGSGCDDEEPGLFAQHLHSADDREAQSLSRSGSESRTLSPSVSTSGSVALSGSPGSGLYTPMLSDASSSKHPAGASPRGHSPASSCARLTVSPSSPRCSSDGAAIQAVGPADASSSGSPKDANTPSERGTDPQRRLLAPGVPLSAEPLTPWAYRGSSASADLGGASSPSVSNPQDGSSPGAPHACDAVSIVAAEPPSLLSGGSDTAEDMVWLLGPVVGTDAFDSAPDSPRIPPPPPLAHSNTTSRGGSARSRRMTTETDESRGGAAGCCSSRRSSSGSCGGGPIADRASLAWHVARGSSRSAGGLGGGTAQARAGPVGPGSCSDGNQLAAPLSPGACGPAASRLGATHVSGLHAALADNGNSSTDSGNGDDSREMSNGTSLVAPESSVGPTASDIFGAMGAVDSPPGVVGIRGCSCSGNGDGDVGGAASSDSRTDSPAPRSPSGASAANSQAVAPSPDLSDISSAAYAAGAYVYGSPYDIPATNTADGPGAGSSARAAPAFGSSAVADGGAGDDLFHNPLYSTPGQGSGGKSPRARPPRDNSGCIALPLMPCSEGLAYGGMDGHGGGASTCTTSPEPASVSQPSVVGSELPAGGPSRRRTREEATATSSYLYDDGGWQRPAADLTCQTWFAAAGSRQGSADGDGAPYIGARAVAAAAAATGGSHGSEPENSLAVGPAGGGSDDGAEAQPLKRARTLRPQPEATASLPEPAGAAVVASQQQAQLLAGRQPPSTPPPPQGPGGAAPARGLPLVTPLMVLNPTYAQSAGGSSVVTTSPHAARSDDVSAARTDATPRHHNLGGASGAARNGMGAKPEGVGRKLDFGGATLTEGSERADQQVTPLQTTPRNRDLLQLQGSDWGSLQGSPSSQQAVHAAALLRHANDAVDYARDAVQRGDVQWLSRVTATLQAVQTALDALRDF